MNFENIYLVGRGTIAISLCKSLQAYHKHLTVLLYDETPVSLFPKYLEKNNINHIFFNTKSDLTTYLRSINSKSLIIHANCFYIYPKDIVNKNNLTIINFHYALLPKHRGKDSLIWAIFDQDEYTGITWHMINEKIDDGDIIIQDKIKISENETPLTLSKKVMAKALECFEKIKKDLLNNTFRLYPMPKEGGSFHCSKDFPNNKYLDLNWSIDKMYAFVRSMDYGMLTKPEDRPKIIYDNKEYIILSYQMQPTSQAESITLSAQTLEIIKDKKQLTLRVD